MKNRRDLPWRRTRDPYAIWVSEIMLQQTRVETVIPYYRPFLERFPDIHSLARARPAAVLAAWSGLGYYGRARNLWEAAGIVAREHAGHLPETPSEMRRLPGIGEYTAAAIASVAFDRPAAAVDGNVVRVLSRILGLKGRRNSGGLRKAVTTAAEALAVGANPGDWTQALMELGATLCLPREPICDRCPVRTRCHAKGSGYPDRYPEAAPAKAPIVEQRILLIARNGDRILMVPELAQTGASWSLPSAKISGDGARTANLLARRLGQWGEVSGPAARFRHRTFSHDLSFQIWETASTGRATSSTHGKWIAPEALQKLPVRAPTLKAVRNLHARDRPPRRSKSC